MKTPTVRALIYPEFLPAVLYDVMPHTLSFVLRQKGFLRHAPVDVDLDIVHRASITR
jgi:hypothetical protein